MDRKVQSNDVKSPRLWIRRIALFDSREPKSTPIRDVVFHRGLNIVLGVELPDNAGANGAQPVTLSGHSVGKTTLCRLIRYCLGESTFGNSGAMSRIKHAFPNGWVGMELTLDEKDWAILRPIGLSGNSVAAQSTNVENLLDQDRQKNQFKQFSNYLEQTMMSELATSSPPNSDKPFEWKHLLAWLTRDQEARFQSLHDWRSPRSEADTPKFQKPKEHALYLIRLVLGLVREKELEIARALADGEKELKWQETKIAELRKEPEYRFNNQEGSLKTILALSQEAVLNTDVSDLTSHVFIYQTGIKNAIASAREDIERIDRKIAEKRILLASYDEERRIFLAVFEATKEGAEFQNAGEPEDDTIKKLRELREKDCTYGNIPFGQCSYIQDRLAKVDKIIDFKKAREEKRAASATELRLNLMEQQRKDHDQIVALLEELREKLNKDIDEKYEKETELAGYSERLKRFEYHLEERQRALDLIEGRTQNTLLQKEITQTSKLRETIERQKKELEDIHSAYYQSLKTIRTVYNGLVKRALSNTYSGMLRMPKGELQFQIEEETGLSGEAVETLSLVLADIAAMICSCQGIGHHPNFLLHDSPREADLDRHIYNRYLGAMWALTEESGGINEAPFQYIVTTTTSPPRGLENAVCLQLEAHPENRMLFGKRLVNPSNEKQLPMFREEKI